LKIAQYTFRITLYNGGIIQHHSFSKKGGSMLRYMPMGGRDIQLAYLNHWKARGFRLSHFIGDLTIFKKEECANVKYHIDYIGYSEIQMVDEKEKK